MNDDLNQLQQLCQDKDWYFKVETAEADRLVVYVNYLNQDVFKAIPDTIAGKQVLVHFKANYLAKQEDFVNQPPLPSLAEEIKHFALPEEEEVDQSYLLSQIDKLLLQCSFDELQTIFYEVHDGKNAVSSISIKYPNIREVMQELYDDFGFDLIHNEIG